MATTKRAQCQFKVKEGINDPFIIAEPCGQEPVGEFPLADPDYLSFQLRPGISLGEAEQIADFLNQHLPYFAITRFGDVEDISRDVRQSIRRHQNSEDTWRAVLEETKASLRAEDLSGALENLKGVEALGNFLLNDWKRVVQQFRWTV